MLHSVLFHSGQELTVWDAPHLRMVTAGYVECGAIAHPHFAILDAVFQMGVQETARVSDKGDDRIMNTRNHLQLVETTEIARWDRVDKLRSERVRG